MSASDSSGECSEIVLVEGLIVPRSDYEVYRAAVEMIDLMMGRGSSQEPALFVGPSWVERLAGRSSLPMHERPSAFEPRLRLVVGEPEALDPARSWEFIDRLLRASRRQVPLPGEPGYGEEEAR